MKTLNENDKLVVITDPQQIMDRLIRDGDLRLEQDEELDIFEIYSDDDLGFYQQGCEYLITRLASQSLVSDNRIAGLEDEIKKQREERDQARREACGLDADIRICNFSDQFRDWFVERRRAAKNRGWDCFDEEKKQGDNK